MANHYYAQQLQEEGSIIDLLAVDDNNKIMMIVCDEEFNTTSAITLTEQEQDDLIAGILERRGVDISAVKELISVWKVMKEEYPLTTKGITAEGKEQSRIHPHKLPTR